MHWCLSFSKFSHGISFDGHHSEIPLLCKISCRGRSKHRWGKCWLFCVIIFDSTAQSLVGSLALILGDLCPLLHASFCLLFQFSLMVFFCVFLCFSHNNGWDGWAGPTGAFAPAWAIFLLSIGIAASDTEAVSVLACAFNLVVLSFLPQSHKPFASCLTSWGS